MASLFLQAHWRLLQRSKAFVISLLFGQLKLKHQCCHSQVALRQSVILNWVAASTNQYCDVTAATECCDLVSTPRRYNLLILQLLSTSFPSSER